MQLVKLKSKKIFQEVFSKGEKIVKPSFVIYRLSNHSHSQVRYGVIASKKQLPTAVERNYARRLLRAILKVLQVKEGYDLILIARKQVTEAGFSNLCEQLKKCF